MNVPAGVFDLTSALVHHSTVAGPLVRRQHVDFIARRLGLGFAALASVPLFLVLRGAPTSVEMLVFACSLTPLGAAVIVLSTGRTAAAHAFAALGLLSFGLSLWLGLGCGPASAIVWLLAAHFEARLSGEKRLSGISDVVTIAALGGIMIAASKIDPARSLDATASAVSAGLALVYAWVIYPTRWQAEVGAPVPVAEPQSDTPTWQAIAHAIEDVVVRFDTTACVTHMRAGGNEKLGLASRDLMDFGLFERLSISDRSLLLNALAQTARRDDTAKITVSLRSDEVIRESSTYRRIELRLRRVETAGSIAPSVIGILRDLGSDPAKAVPLPSPIAAVIDEISPKNHFSPNMSHELRTPLNAIIGFSEMLASHTLRPADADKQREYAKIIHQSGQHLLSVVDSILDTSKIHTNTFSVAAGRFADREASATMEPWNTRQPADAVPPLSDTRMKQVA